MESEAPEKFFVNNAEHPAFLLFPKYSFLATNNKVSLYMNGVSLIANFKTEKLAKERLKQIIENANFPTRVYQVSKTGQKRGKRILFAENKIVRVQLTENPCRVFNIEEWSEVKLAPT
jgi:rRNA processing protein Krr1/Pno1